MTKMLTPKQFAAEVELHPDTVREMCRRSLLKATKTSKGRMAHWRIPVSEVNRVLTEGF